MGTSGSGKRTNSKKYKKNNGNSRKTGSKNNRSNEAPSFMRGEVVIWGTLAVSVVLLLSNFGIGGKVGSLLSAFLFGVEGLFAYVFPVFLFLIVAFAVINKGNGIALIKTIAAVVLVFMICTFCQLLNGQFDRSMSLGDYYRNSAVNKVGGGLFGGLFTKLFCGAFGKVIAYVLVVILMIICIVLITEKSLLSGLHKGGSAVRNGAKNSHRRIKESQANRQRIREENRRQQEAEEKRYAEERARQEEYERATENRRTLKGVTMDTELSEKKSPGMTELYIKRPEPAKTVEAVASEDAVQAEIKPRRRTSSASIRKKEPNISAQASAVPDTMEPLPEITDDVITKAEKVNTAQEVRKVEEEIARTEQKVLSEYNFPPLHLLAEGNKKAKGMSDEQLKATARKLQETLDSFGVRTRVTNISCGPSITRYELQPEQGVKVSRILNLADDIKLNLAAADIRIEAPIPGKAAVGIEVPNSENTMVTLRELLESDEFKYFKGSIAFAVGRDIGGKTMVTDIFKMPHLLIGGATGSGKSVCINTLIMSILYKYGPEDVKFIMIDPKMIELNIYNGIPHLIIPVVTDPKKAAGALQWAVNEMTKRYMAFQQVGVRDLQGYNEKIKTMEVPEGEKPYQKMSRIVIVVDEFADLMMVASGDVEEAVCRLAQLARAAGIHLILATQRPSVDVITGLIKANMPSRIALAVSSGVDSRTIIDMVGAEKLLGHGDMLFYPSGLPKPVRVQGAFVSEREVEEVVNYIIEKNGDASYDDKVANEVENHANGGSTGMSAMGGASGGDGNDSLFADAARFVIDKEKASIGSLQRAFKIGFNRAARIMDQLCEAGVVSEEDSTKPRRVLMTSAQFEAYLNGDPMEEELE